jgi:acyl-CoA thioester hydrolase
MSDAPRFREQEYRTTVHPEHLDMFDHVNNAAYLQLFEEARWDFITRNGYGPDQVRARRLGPTILEVTLRFRREIRGGAALRIVSRTTEYKSKIGRLAQEMFLENGESACAAEFVFGLFDLDGRRLVRPTPEWLKAVGVEP